jgi:hypothetical protein
MPDISIVTHHVKEDIFRERQLEVQWNTPIHQKTRGRAHLHEDRERLRGRCFAPYLYILQVRKTFKDEIQVAAQNSW